MAGPRFLLNCSKCHVPAFKPVAETFSCGHVYTGGIFHQLWVPRMQIEECTQTDRGEHEDPFPAPRKAKKQDEPCRNAQTGTSNKHKSRQKREAHRQARPKKFVRQSSRKNNPAKASSEDQQYCGLADRIRVPCAECGGTLQLLKIRNVTRRTFSQVLANLNHQGDSPAHQAGNEKSKPLFSLDQARKNEND